MNGERVTRVLKNIFTIDLRALAVFRISLALLVLAELADRAAVLKTFYTDEGLFPRNLAMTFLRRSDWSLLFINGSVEFTILLFLVAACFALFLLAGYRTRLANWVCYLFIISLQNRNVMIPNGGDYLLRLLLFWSLFLPLGQYFSVDARGRTATKESPYQMVSVGTAGFLFQVAFIYLFSSLSKMGSEVWMKGEAVHDALMLEHYGRPFAAVFLHVLSPAVMKMMTYTVVGIEFVGSLLLFSPLFTAPLRLALIFILAQIQLGFGLSLEVNLFAWVAVATTIPFLPTPFIDFLIKKIQKFKKIPAKASPLLLKTSFLSNLLAGFFLLYITVSNVEGLTYKSPLYHRVLPQTIIPYGFRWIGNLLTLDQSWDMFMPPGKVIYWYVIVGKLRNGTSVDILRDGAPVQWEKPRQFFKNEPWRAYLVNLGSDKFKEAMAPYVGPYFCREWNRREPSDRQLLELEVFLMSQESAPGSTRYFLSLGKHTCQP